MKEVKFRWVDKYLIHMSLKTKFSVLAIIPIIALIGLSVLLNSVHKQNQLDAQVAQAQIFNQQFNDVIDIASQHMSETDLKAFLGAVDGNIAIYNQHLVSLRCKLKMAEIALSTTNILTA
ncbi:hypothetical protein TUM4438_19730 [Shewanella sairae]|uniref:Methyl-accepting chemotaxis protein n=1 Tax=Shewanella sairae TaxID=190310 RepID=A0ABQ4PDT9_9GAMM|nr:hypothetical protein [Shewanella sairae]MCL1129083.1 hypothetical protein [Shewanella sairae]GIU45687.1 hypothetical protein TUM4438_19730 [Shewanella sairae]